MNKILQKVKFIIIIIFCWTFFIHVSILIYEKLNPDLPEVKYYKRDLNEIDFPIAFELCIVAKISHISYKDLGYNDLFHFFHGTSMFNDSIVGWGGHTENGSSLGSVAGPKTMS